MRNKFLLTSAFLIISAISVNSANAASAKSSSYSSSNGTTTIASTSSPWLKF